VINGGIFIPLVILDLRVTGDGLGSGLDSISTSFDRGMA
jgi:hypothetical protein